MEYSLGKLEDVSAIVSLIFQNKGLGKQLLLIIENQVFDLMEKEL